MHVYLTTLGCRLNEAEIESWASAFRRQGHALTAQADSADLVVVNTCAVTEEAGRKSRQLIRRVQRQNPHAKLVVSGCFVSLDGTQALEGVDVVVSNRDKDRLVEIATDALSLPAMPEFATEPGEAAMFPHRRNRAFVKVQDGCRHRCTFCVVTIARGEERSRRISDVVAQINALTAQGVKEVVLTGVHLGGYGSDLGSDLAELIRAVLNDTDCRRLRLGSLEPWNLPPKFFRLFAAARLMPHLHLPLQSGSDSVLKRMARRCRTRDFEALVAHARSEIADFQASTDIIVGFPGETEREWQEGLQFIEGIEFLHLHVFPYSPRPGTQASRFAEQVTAAIKRRRTMELHALAKRMKARVLSAHLGREFSVLWESAQPADTQGAIRYLGYTPNFLRVETTPPAGRVLENMIQKARIKALGQDGEKLIAALA
ncbi:MAG: tRNA (N(6)-L-threonylcarbamoyladenosine(37)-C(2))-methylthiotransferase MtaB [Gammaproteobacteria bacterium]